MSTVRIALAGFAAVACATCGGGSAPSAPDGPHSPAKLAKITVSVVPQTINVGLTATATVRGADVVGNAFATGPVTWTSSEPGVASVSSGGQLTALAPGVTTITAEAGGLSATAQLTVTTVAIPPVVLRISPEAAELDAGQQVQLTGLRIEGTDTTAAGALTWESSAPSVAAVSPDGIVTGRAGGLAVVAGALGSIRGTMTVTVRPNVDTSIHVNVATPPAGVEVGDSVRVIGTVTPLSRVMARVVASVETIAVPLDTVYLGAMRDVPGWGGVVPLKSVSLGVHLLVVTAYAMDGAVSADTIAVDREVPQEGGVLPGGGKKRVTPARDTLTDPLALRRP